MNLEQQVVSLELAKRIKELGIKQESLFYWCEKLSDKTIHIATKGNLSDKNTIFQLREFNSSNNSLYGFGCECCNEYFDVEKEIFSALAASELLHILPHYIDTNKDEPFNYFRFNMHMVNLVDEKDYTAYRVYSINYLCDSFEMGELIQFPRQLFEHNIFDKSLPDCIAKVLIRLIEDGRMKV